MKLLKISQKTDEWLASLAQQATPDIDECVEHLGCHIEWLNEFK